MLGGCQHNCTYLLKPTFTSLLLFRLCVLLFSKYPSIRKKNSTQQKLKQTFQVTATTAFGPFLKTGHESAAKEATYAKAALQDADNKEEEVWLLERVLL